MLIRVWNWIIILRFFFSNLVRLFDIVVVVNASATVVIVIIIIKGEEIDWS